MLTKNISSKNILASILAMLFSVSAVTLHAAVLPVPAPPQVAAKSYLVIDFNSGRVLAEKKSDKKVEPASITKLMTAYVIYNEMEAGRLSMEDEVTISKKAWRMKGSRMFVEVGSKVSVKNLMKGLIIQSGNDATVALAEHIAGSEQAFVGLMNQYAVQLEMADTNYVNSTGWPNKKHVTTARDIAKLARAIISEFPEHYKWYSEKSFVFNNINQYNRNKLLWRDNSVDGLKTGHTDSAGYCLVASAKRSDMRLITVVLGTKSEKSRASISQSLLNYGFRFYETHKLYSAGETLKRSRVWKGEYEEVALGLNVNLYVTIPRGSYKHLKATMDVNTNIEAPLKKGAQLGVVRVHLGDEKLYTAPLVALQKVDEGGFFQVIKDYIIRLFV